MGDRSAERAYHTAIAIPGRSAPKTPAGNGGDTLHRMARAIARARLTSNFP
ncbi:MAG TPA: hypothetical protein V6D46_00470 [Coleofasciculaceae cyanobacterium]